MSSFLPVSYTVLTGNSEAQYIEFAVSRVFLDEHFARLLKLFGISRIEDLDFIDDGFIDRLHSMIHDNACKGRADLTTYADQVTFLGGPVRHNQLQEFTISVVDCAKLLRIPLLKTELEEMRSKDQVKKRRLCLDNSKLEGRFSESTESSDIELSTTSSTISGESSLSLKRSQQSTSQTTTPKRKKLMKQCLAYQDSGTSSSGALTPPRRVLENASEVANVLASVVVKRINQFWAMTDYDGPMLDIIDINRTFHLEQKQQLIRLSARCLVCNEYYSINMVGTRDFTLQNYSRHAARHIMFEDKGVKYLKKVPGVPKQNQPKISSFFVKAKGKTAINVMEEEVHLDVEDTNCLACSETVNVEPVFETDNLVVEDTSFALDVDTEFYYDRGNIQSVNVEIQPNSNEDDQASVDSDGFEAIYLQVL